MTLVLFLLGSVGHLLTVAMQAARTLRQSVPVSVELRRELSDERRAAIGEALAQEELVGTVVFSSKEEKAEDETFRQLFADEFEAVLDENPLADSFELTLTSGSADAEGSTQFASSRRWRRPTASNGSPSRP